MGWRGLMWVEFAVGSHLAEGFSGFPPSSETNNSKFHFSPDLLLGWVIQIMPQLNSLSLEA